MKILVGVDDSPCSKAALELVKTIRWPAGTHVNVVSAVPLPAPIYTDAYVPAAIDTWGEVMALQRKQYEELVSRVEKDLGGAGLKTSAEVLDGDPREAIVDAAKRENVDLIVVGSHGRTGLDKMLMGSVSSHVVNHAPCSVLVVREKAR